MSPRDRYADAESLAKDLERFLNHQPLLKAGNPSRRERVGNLWMRQRLKLARAGMAGVLLLVLCAALFPMINEWRTHSYLTRADFQVAVKQVENDEFEKAVRPLETSSNEFPRACLAKVYYAFVIDDEDSDDEADEQMREHSQSRTRSEPYSIGAKSTLKFLGCLWILPRLGSFVPMNSLRSTTRTNPVPTSGGTRSFARPAILWPVPYLTSRRSSIPRSQKIQRLLAKTELIRGKYEAARDRFSHVIKALSDGRDADDASSDEEERVADAKFYCHENRARADFFAVEQELAQRVAKPTITFIGWNRPCRT